MIVRTFQSLAFRGSYWWRSFEFNEDFSKQIGSSPRVKSTVDRVHTWYREAKTNCSFLTIFRWTWYVCWYLPTSKTLHTVFWIVFCNRLGFLGINWSPRFLLVVGTRSFSLLRRRFTFTCPVLCWNSVFRKTYFCANSFINLFGSCKCASLSCLNNECIVLPTPLLERYPTSSLLFGDEFSSPY